MTLINYEERLKTVLYKKGILITNRKDRYDQVIKRLMAADILKGIEKNPRLLGPTIILLVQHQKIFEKYEKLYQLCEISNDGRVKGVHKKVRKNFRFDENVLIKLQKIMKEGEFKTETEDLESLVLEY